MSVKLQIAGLFALVAIVAGAQVLAQVPGKLARADAGISPIVDTLDVTIPGKLDREFLARLIGPDQAAIDLAHVVVEHGTDPETKRFAQDLIDSREREVASLKGLLSKQAVN